MDVCMKTVALWSEDEDEETGLMAVMKMLSLRIGGNDKCPGDSLEQMSLSESEGCVRDLQSHN